MKDHMGSTCAHHYTHIPSFINVAHTKLWIFDFFVISQSEQTCKWGIKYAHSVTKDHVGSTCAPPLPTNQVCDKIGHCVLVRARRFTFWCWRDLTSVHTSVHPYRQRYNWKLSGPSSITGGPQKRIHIIIFGHGEYLWASVKEWKPYRWIDTTQPAALCCT